MAAFLSVDPTSDIPLYRQIVQRVQDGVTAGRLEERVRSVRGEDHWRKSASVA